MSYLNVAAYQFTPLDQLPKRRASLKELCGELALKGTILLSTEGINLFVAGTRSNVDTLIDTLRQDPLMRDLETKESLSEAQPFHRMLVKIKREIIAFGVPDIDPLAHQETKLPAEEFKQWLDQSRDMVVLDVRNDYEIGCGTFESAVPIGLDHFRDFPAAVEKLPESWKEKTIVSFCTGGIRCEKAVPLLKQAGFSDVYQLDGGILKYFETCGGDHYRGECFVFDQRVAVDSQLQETETVKCFACLSPLSPEEQRSDRYIVGESCPRCYLTPEQREQRQRARREQTIASVADPLPGSEPYTNQRPLTVPGRLDGARLADALAELCPQITAERWVADCDAGHLQRRGKPITLQDVVAAGDQLVHIVPNTVEPDVSTEIKVIYEDAALFVVNKPAPLPVHPCGRFNRNTLVHLLKLAVKDAKLRPAHRLDAHTTGVQVLTKNRDDARRVQAQFEARSVIKDYLVAVKGRFPSAEMNHHGSIARQPGTAGLRHVVSGGDTAHTEIRRLTVAEHESLLLARPHSGRTNQIRVHLAELGHPVLGDMLYGDPEDATDLRLHAWRLSIDHPRDGRRVTFEAQPPAWTGGVDLPDL